MWCVLQEVGVVSVLAPPPVILLPRRQIYMQLVTLVLIAAFFCIVSLTAGRQPQPK